MRSDDPRIEKHVVDGQLLLVPTEDAWRAIEEAGGLDGRPIGVGRLLAQYRKIAVATPGAYVALGQPPGQNKPWWIYHLVKVDGSFHRVRLERQTCRGCGWSVRTGIAKDYAIYIGTADPLEAMTAHLDDPTLPCTGCGASLPLPPIWLSAF